MEKGGRKNQTLWAAVLLAGMMLLFYLRYLPHPGSLYARVVREFWPIYHTWPHFELSRRIFAKGHFPLWNPLNAFGTPLLANFQAAPFHPARMLLFLFPFWTAIDLWLLLRALISGMGTYWFLRWEGDEWPGAVLAACAWMFCGSLTDYANVHYLDVDLLLPFGLLAFGWMVRTGGLASVMASVMVVFLAFLGGNPTSVFYLLIFLTLYYFHTAYRLGESVSDAWIRFGVVACLSGLIGAVVLLPFREFLAYSWNYHPVGFWNVALDGRYLLSLFGPEAYPGTNLPAAPLVQRAPYIGSVVLVLSFSAFFYLRRISPTATFLAGFMVIFGGLIWGVLPYYLVGFLPILSRTANFRYAMPEVSFCAALLAGMAWNHIAHFRENISKYLVLPVVLTLTAGVFALSKKAGTLDFPVRGPGMAVLCGFAWGAVLVVLLYRAKRKLKYLCFGALLALWLFEAYLHARYLPLLSPDDPTYWKVPPVASISQLRGGRFYGHNALMYPNLNMTCGGEDLRYFGALYVARYRHFMSAINEQSPQEALDEFIPYNFIAVEPDKLQSRALDLAGVKVILSGEPLPPNRLIDRLLMLGKVRAPGREYVLKRKMAIASDMRNSLYQHPPSLLEAAVPAGKLRFGIGIDPTRWGTNGDGVTFMVLEHEGGNSRCLFVRHINPARCAWDRWWLNYALTIDEGATLSLITLPGLDSRNDWAAWGDLRSSAFEPGARYELVDTEPFRVYRNPSAMPRAFVVSRAVVGDEERCTSKVVKELDFRNVACLEGWRAYEARAGLGDNQGVRVKWRRDASDKVTVKTSLEKRGLVVVTETYYPGWKAYLEDGSEIFIHPADGMFRAVVLPPGEHNVTFVYKPVSFKIGLWTTIVTLLTMATFIWSLASPPPKRAFPTRTTSL